MMKIAERDCRPRLNNTKIRGEAAPVWAFALTFVKHTEYGEMQIGSTILRSRTLLFAFTSGLFLVGGSTDRAKCLAAPQAPIRTELDTTSLVEIEKRVLPPVLVDGPAAHDSLPAYYQAANEPLMERLGTSSKKYQRVPHPFMERLTLVAGPAGIGKTFIKGAVCPDDLPEKVVCKIDMHDLYVGWQADEITTEQPDLADHDIVLNQMLTVRDKSVPRIRDYLHQQQAYYYVIDSLDEIHSDDYSWVLEQIRQFVFDGQNRFIHVAVFARCPSFRRFWRDCQSRNLEEDIQLYILNPPRFRTTGDLMVSSWNYHTWAFKLRRTAAPGESTLTTLDDYSRWVDSGFSRFGEFATVMIQPNNHIRPDVHNTLVNWSKQHRVVCGTLYNLAGNGMLREIVAAETVAGRDYDPRRFMEAYLEAWLVRETGVDDRPSSANPGYASIYHLMLQQIAAKSLHDGELDEDGFFPVRADEEVVVQDADKQYHFRIAAALDHSGIATTDPRQSAPTPKYRFEPFWFHRLLVEIHNEQVQNQNQTETTVSVSRH